MTAAPDLNYGQPQWQRSVRVAVTDVLVENLDGRGLEIGFRVLKHNRPEPNETEITIYNLPAKVRQLLTDRLNKAKEQALSDRLKERNKDFELSLAKIFGDPTKTVKVGPGTGPLGKCRVEAGYGGAISMLSLTEIADIRHEPPARGSTEWVTYVRAQDGHIPWKDGIVSESIVPGVNTADLARVLTASFNATLGADAEKTLLEGLNEFGVAKVDGGYILHGPVREEMTNLFDSFGITAVFEDGEVRLIPFEGTTLDFAVELNPRTGLLEPPLATELGRYQTTSLLNPHLRPGRQVRLADALRRPVGAGIFRVDQVEHVGETHTASWTSVCQLRPTKLG